MYVNTKCFTEKSYPRYVYLQVKWTNAHTRKFWIEQMYTIAMDIRQGGWHLWLEYPNLSPKMFSTKAYWIQQWILYLWPGACSLGHPKPILIISWGQYLSFKTKLGISRWPRSEVPNFHFPPKQLFFKVKFCMIHDLSFMVWRHSKRMRMKFSCPYDEF